MKWTVQSSNRKVQPGCAMGTGVNVFKFNLLKSDGEFRVVTHIVDEHNWLIAISVLMCEPHELRISRTFTFIFL
jgi:hypothetical protein